MLKSRILFIINTKFYLKIKMATIRLFSDVHCEFGRFHAPILPNEKDMVCVLAGDIGVAHRPKTIGPFVNEMARRYKAVVYVLGNHEHYQTSVLRTMEKVRAAIGMYPEYDLDEPDVQGIPDNVHILENQDVVIDDVAFIGSTLWTDFRKGNPHVMLTARDRMNDYKCIRIGPIGEPYRRRLKPQDTYSFHDNAKRYIFPKIAEHKALGRKVFVVTHHAPSEQSIAPEFRNPSDDLINPCYATELGYEILDANPNCWVHGHIHTSLDYMIGETRVVCNPRGYHGHALNPTFQPTLVIEI